jgi:hypothetical protein
MKKVSEIEGNTERRRDIKQSRAGEKGMERAKYEDEMREEEDYEEGRRSEDGRSREVSMEKKLKVGRSTVSRNNRRRKMT